MNRWAHSTTPPIASTDVVCISEMATPPVRAWRTLPPAPTRYAAMMVLPWPGATACSAPNPIASSRHNPTTGSDRPDRSTRLANDPPMTPGRCPSDEATPAGAGAPPAWTPGANENVARVTRSGLDSSAVGYTSSVSLTDRVGTVDPATASPFAPTAVISRHPIRSAYACSLTATRPARADGAVYVSTSQRR